MCSPCWEQSHPGPCAVCATFGTSIGSGPLTHWKQSDTALELSPGPCPFSKSDRCSSGSVGASRWFHCRWSWSLEMVCLKLAEGTDVRVEVDRRNTFWIWPVPAPKLEQMWGNAFVCIQAPSYTHHACPIHLAMHGTSCMTTVYGPPNLQSTLSWQGVTLTAWKSCGHPSWLMRPICQGQVPRHHHCHYCQPHLQWPPMAQLGI